MESEQGHDAIIRGLQELLAPVLDASEQAVYVYLDDAHKFCNDNFAELLGYSSAEEWKAVKTGFLESFVEAGSQDDVGSAYMEAMNRRIGSKIEVTWKKKDGAPVESSVILVPIAYQGNLAALHFVSVRE